MKVTITIDADDALTSVLERMLAAVAPVVRAHAGVISVSSEAPEPPGQNTATTPGADPMPQSVSVHGALAPSRARAERTEAQREADRLRKQRSRDRARRREAQIALTFAGAAAPTSAPAVTPVPPVTEEVSDRVTVTVPPRDRDIRAPAVSETSGIEPSDSGVIEKRIETNTPSVPSESERVTRESEVVTEEVTAPRDIGDRDLKPEKMSEGRTEGLLFSLGEPRVSVSWERVLRMFVDAYDPKAPADKKIVPFVPEKPDAFAAAIARLAVTFDESAYATLIQCAMSGYLGSRYRAPLTLMQLLGPAKDDYPARGLFTVLDIATKWQQREQRAQSVKLAPAVKVAAMQRSETTRDALIEQARALKQAKTVDGKEMAKFR